MPGEQREVSVHSSSAISLFDLCFSPSLCYLSPSPSLEIMKAIIEKRGERDSCWISSSPIQKDSSAVSWRRASARLSLAASRLVTAAWARGAGEGR